MTPNAPAPLASKLDFVLRNGILLDGSGGAPYQTDIGVRAGKIVALGDLSQTKARVSYELAGLHVAPGFIDIHTHSDISVTYDPGQASALAMGVTTQVVGNCGLSMAHVQNTDTFEFERRWLAPHGARVRWDRFEEHLQLVEDTGVATNYLTLIGHGSIRKRAMGLSKRAPLPEELLAMQREVAHAMEQGAYGLSTGLEYPPSAFAETAELVSLCKVASEYGGFYATHLRNEGDTLIESVQEALDIAKGANIPLQLSHHKAEGVANWGKVKTTLKMADEAREAGLDVQLDQYPYTAFMTSLAVQILPSWALEGNAEEAAQRLRDPQTRAAILQEVRRQNPHWDSLEPGCHWESLQIGVARGMPEILGKTVASLARAAQKNPLEYLFDLLSEAKDYIAAVNFAICEEDIALVMRHPYTSIGSDGVGTHPDTATRGDKIHPRTYGAFARVLGVYARERGILTEAVAIRKMTALPAARLKLLDRGGIFVGACADIVLYDPQEIADAATFEEPHRFATGVRRVFVNGEVAYENGAPTGIRAGRVLRRQ